MDLSVNRIVIGADPKFLSTAKKDMGELPGIEGMVGFTVIVGEGLYGWSTNCALTHTNEECESLPPLLETVRVGIYLPAVAYV